MRLLLLILIFFLLICFPVMGEINDLNVPDGRQIVGKYQASAKRQLNYQIILETDTNNRVQVYVCVSGHNQSSDYVKLEWSSVDIDSYAEFGADDSWIPQPAGFSLGEENSLVSYCPKTIQVEKDMRALLITQIAGFEHIKRRHDLFVILEEKGKPLVKLIWSGKEGAGPHYSWIESLDLDGDGTEELMHFKGFKNGSDYPDKWSYTAFGWNKKHGLIEEITDKEILPHVYAAIISTHKTISQAREAEKVLYTNANCLKELSFFVVIKTDGFLEMNSEQYIIAAFSIRENEVSDKLRKIKACNPKIDGFVTQVR